MRQGGPSFWRIVLERIARSVDQENQEDVARLEGDAQALEALRKSQTSLVKQVRDKLAALEIENACRRVTPAQAGRADGLERRRTRSLSTALSTQLKQVSPVGASGASPRMKEGVEMEHDSPQVKENRPQLKTTAVSKPT